MFTSNVPTYRIDLEKEEANRWSEVIVRENETARCLGEEASVIFKQVPELLRLAFAHLYRSSGGLYQDEIASWAEGLGVSVGTATILNCAYELSHLRWPKIFGCTAGIRWVEGLGMVHVRSLDWPLATMGAATRLFRFHRGSREFVSVGVPGHVGVLSGMLPNAYSVTINWAPPVACPCFDFGPAFLLRNTLETCDTYDAAVCMLTDTPLSTSVFFTVCGTAYNQACVIERTQREASLRPMNESVLVQANHHVAERFADNNKDILEGDSEENVFSLTGSRKRADTLRNALSDIALAAVIDRVADSLNIGTVLNQETCQQMAFCPSIGEVKVWRKDAG